MALKLYDENSVISLANAIRAKNGTSETYTLSQMASAVEGISGGGAGEYDIEVTLNADDSQNLYITDAIEHQEVGDIVLNGLYNVKSYTQVSVNVPNGGTEWVDFLEGRALYISSSYINGLTSLRSSAFSRYVSLYSIGLPNTCTAIGLYAFANCTQLSNVSLGNALESIANYAFSGCSALSSIILPTTIKYIGTYAFRNCTQLSNVNILATTPPTVTSTTFTTSYINNIYVPAGTLEDYLADNNWNYYSNILIESSI